MKDADGNEAGGTLDHDEVQTFVLARYISSCEAVSGIMSDYLSMVSLLIVRLAVRLHHKHMVRFEEGLEEEALAQIL